MNTAFYISAAVAVMATAMVLTRAVAVHALLYFVVAVLAVAMVLASLGASFVAALEVIIYAGGIMVLFVFVVMMLNLSPQAAAGERQLLRGRMWIGPAALAAILLAELVYVLAAGGSGAATGKPVGPKDVSVSMFTTYMLGVEMVSLLLLAALVGALHLGRSRPEDQPPAVAAGQAPSAATAGSAEVRP